MVIIFCAVGMDSKGEFFSNTVDKIDGVLLWAGFINVEGSDALGIVKISKLETLKQLSFPASKLEELGIYLNMEVPVSDDLGAPVNVFFHFEGDN